MSTAAFLPKLDDVWLWTELAALSAPATESQVVIAPCDATVVGFLWGCDLNGATLGADVVLKLFVDGADRGPVFTLPSATRQREGGEAPFPSPVHVPQGVALEIQTDGASVGPDKIGIVWLLRPLSQAFLRSSDIALSPTKTTMNINSLGDPSLPIVCPVDGTLEAIVGQVVNNTMDADTVLRISINADGPGSNPFATLPNGLGQRAPIVLRPASPVDVKLGDHIFLDSDGAQSGASQFAFCWIIRPRSHNFPSSYAFASVDEMNIANVDIEKVPKPAPFYGELKEVILNSVDGVDVAASFDVRMGETDSIDLLKTGGTLGAYEAVRMAPRVRAYVHPGQAISIVTNGEPTVSSIGVYTCVFAP